MQKNFQSKPRAFSSWFNQNYMWIITGLLFLFLLVAFLAPILMKLGLEQPAKFIYWVYEKATGDFQLDLKFARAFLGNEALGYKVALCQRDVAIYGSLLLFGLIFQLSGKKIKPIHWYLWIILGLLPIGVDGITQFGGLGISFLAWLPIRESTPLLRTITGVLFGITTGLFMFPMVEENMSQSNSKE
jgi:uncharacterized membrane protein